MLFRASNEKSPLIGYIQFRQATEADMDLRNGQRTRDRRLDRCRHVDLRTLNYPVRSILTADQYANPRSYSWRLTERLDQGAEGACVGFGFAHELAARPGVVTGVSDNYARHLYWDAQRCDPWEGGSYDGAKPFYEGTSVQAGAATVRSRKLISEYRWAFNLTDLTVAVGYHGPAVIGVDWFEGMLEADKAGFVRPTGEVVGGHCVCIVAVKIVRAADGSLDHLKSYFTIQNSWGPAWGFDGRCRISLIDMAVLWPGGDFCIPVGRVAAVAA